MLTVIAKRLLIAIPSLIGVVIVTFLLTRALPGDPAAYFAGPAATKEAIQEIRVKLGLDKSLPQQFIRYVGDLAKGTSANRSPPASRSSPRSATASPPPPN
jgi:peptide/nickel transport system permease protein